MRHEDILGQGTVNVVLVARDVGLLAALDGEPATAEEHARALELDPEATQLLLEALRAIGYLRREEGRYHNTVWRLGGMSVWDLLPGFVQRGERASFIDRADQRGEAYGQVVRKLSDRSRPVARMLAATLQPAARILDVGAGAGVWSLCMAQQWSDTVVTALDLPEVLPQFEQHAAELGLSSRTRSLSGSYFEADLPVVDRVVLANVLHLETADDAAALARRCAECVAPGGDVVVVDCLPSSSDEAQLFHALYSIHLRMRTAKGAVHATETVRAWFADLGFGDIDHHYFDDQMPGGGALICRRSELS